MPTVDLVCFRIHKSQPGVAGSLQAGSSSRPGACPARFYHADGRGPMDSPRLLYGLLYRDRPPANVLSTRLGPRARRRHLRRYRRKYVARPPPPDPSYRPRLRLLHGPLLGVLATGGQSRQGDWGLADQARLATGHCTRDVMGPDFTPEQDVCGSLPYASQSTGSTSVVHDGFRGAPRRPSPLRVLPGCVRSARVGARIRSPTHGATCSCPTTSATRSTPWVRSHPEFTSRARGRPRPRAAQISAPTRRIPVLAVLAYGPRPLNPHPLHFPLGGPTPSSSTTGTFSRSLRKGAC